MFGMDLTAEQRATVSRYLGRAWAGAIIIAGVGYGLAHVMGGPRTSKHRQQALAKQADDKAHLAHTSSQPLSPSAQDAKTPPK
ncbi:hypothetical protein H4R34_000944 [Dimargaris verticillata]|uniref:Uncharacterized protein n=1 Tax=Dimargaris verticillata TaxID=2761393 RepID=A0A9W8BBP5_9FUNG|nr:hypothetical protein H4R34_000944 [Dimargaris verticillata]